MIGDFVPRARHATRAAFLCAVLTTATGAADFDVSRYQPAQLRDIAEDVPGQHGVTIARDIPVRTRLSYLGEFRELPETSRRLIATWGDAMGVAGMLDVFRREVRLRQGGRDHWLPVQESLATTRQRSFAQPSRSRSLRSTSAR